MRTSKRNRLLSMLLVAVMLMTLLPAAAFAKTPSVSVNGDTAVNHVVTDLAELTTGSKVVIFNPANNKALSSNYTGYYNSGVDVVLNNGKLSGYGATEVWTVTKNDDGSYYFATSEGKKLSMGASYTSMPLDDVNTAWNVSAAKTDGCFYIKNVARNNFMKWYADKNNWSAYYSIGSDEALFAQKFYLVVEDPQEQPDPDEILKNGDEVVIYSANAGAVLAAQNDTLSIDPAAAEIVDGKAVPENGGVVFTVEKNGQYYRFKNEAYGYLCSNGNGNNAFYSKDFSGEDQSTDDADWLIRTCSGGVGGYEMESRTAKFNGVYSQWLEYFAVAFKTYGMNKVTDYTIYSFEFYPIADNVKLVNGVVNDPKIVFNSASVKAKGIDYELSFTLEDPADSITKVEGGYDAGMSGSDLVDFTADGRTYTTVIPSEWVDHAESFVVGITVTNSNGLTYTAELTVSVEDVISFVDLTPKNGFETGDDKRPEISAEVVNVGEDPTVEMKINGKTVEAEYVADKTVAGNGKVVYVPDKDMADGKVNVELTVTRKDGKSGSEAWFFNVGKAQYQLYFGQLHSHTGEYSDGSGTLADALNYVKNLPESANVDFVAFTDHSNYFDNTSAANPEDALYDMSKATAASREKWDAYKSAVAVFNEENAGNIVAIAGFEMTWSGGPGHINTFNTPGIVSRNNSTLNNKTNDSGMKAYYALLNQTEGKDSISQFNHPGTTFGTFSDFSYWDAAIDTRINLVEVGNGEGQIGSGGYYPSYEYYIMALDKGWHVAPTNNQDNHKGKWGNANDARDVILTDNFTEEGIYEAMRSMRMYSTEDKNLELYYTVNGLQLGSQITEVPEKLDIDVQVYDPDASDSIAKIEVVVNSGKTAYTWDDPEVLATGHVTATLDPEYTYYFIRVTEADGDLAVTAPVWVGESLKLGISSFECGTATPVTGEELTLTTTLFNSEASDATVKSVVYTTEGSVVLGTDTKEYTVPSSGTATVDFKYTPKTAKLTKITVTVNLVQDGKDYSFSKDIELDVLDANSLVYIGIDASHYNEYVAGNYKDSMGNFGNLAAGYSVRTVMLKTSDELIAACSNDKFKALILTAPSRRLAAAQSDPKVYTDAELAAIKAFNAAGGTVVLAGWSDNYENYDVIQSNADILHMAATQNAVLQALGSSLRISDDATYDDVRSAADGVDKWRLYFNTYGDSFLTDGVIYDAEHPYDRLYTEVFSHYGGASIYAVDASGNPVSALPASVSPVVYGHASTYSVDVDGDGLGGDATPKYAYASGDSRLLVMATEQLDGKGLIVVSGAAFMSNFEVQASVSDDDSDSDSQKNYSNYRICENLVQYINPVKVTPIATVQKQTEAGYKYTIEGVVTTNASGYDKNTAFFDCIYVQDETGGICCFPIAGNYKIGDKVRITGTTDFYQGEMELQVTSIEKIGEATPVQPKVVLANDVNNKTVLGSLITVRGTVESFELENGLIQTIMVKDSLGNVVRVFIDGYICTDNDVKGVEVGCGISVTGVASYDDTFAGPAPRIRISNRADIVVEPFNDIGNSGYRDWIFEAAEKGIINGYADGSYRPNALVTRAQFITMLWRAAGSPESKLGALDFSDASTVSTPYVAAVKWGVENKIIQGYGDDTFHPDQTINRAQMATFMYRYLKNVAGYDFGEVKPCSFNDAGDIAAPYLDAVNAIVSAGIMNGTSATTFAPNSSANRGMAATVILRVYNLLNK